MSTPSPVVLPAKACPFAEKTTVVVPGGRVTSVPTRPWRSTLTMRSGSATRAVSPDSQPVASTGEARVASRLRDEPSSGTRSSRVPEATGTAAMRRIPLGSRAAEVAPGPRSVTPVGRRHADQVAGSGER